MARKPGALRNGTPFKDWLLPSATERIRRKLAGSADGDRQMVTILVAVKAGELAPLPPLFTGGKSFDARMTSQAEAAEPMPNVRGLIFLGFPLHPAGKPSTGRGQHLSDVRCRCSSSRALETHWPTSICSAERWMGLPMPRWR